MQMYAVRIVIGCYKSHDSKKVERHWFNGKLEKDTRYSVKILKIFMGFRGYRFFRASNQRDYNLNILK